MGNPINHESKNQDPAFVDGSLAHYAGIVASVTDAIISIDEHQTIVLFNPAAERMFGYTQGQVLGESLDVLLPIPVRDIHRNHIYAFDRSSDAARPMGIRQELVGLRADGTAFPIEASISKIEMSNRKVFTAIVRDVSDRRRIERSLRERAEYLRVLNSIHHSILIAPTTEAIAQIVLDRMPEVLPYRQSCVLLADAREQELVVMAANLNANTHLQPRMVFPASEFGFGQIRTKTSREGMVEIISDTDAANIPARMKELLEGEGIRAVLEIPLVVADSHIGILHLYDTAPRSPTDAEVESALYIADILAVALQQARLHQVVDTTRERLHALSHRQLELEEIQRRRMSRDLHDMVGQNLTALNINLHAIGRKLPADTPEAVRARLEDSSRLVEEIVDRIRNLMADLRPSILDDLGLTPALRWYTAEFSRRTELVSHAIVEEIQPRLAQDVETALFRIAQEALTNIAKHAQASEALVQLQLLENRVELTISDDGKGFDFAAMRRDPSKRGVGLVDMRERAEAIGGRIWVECEPGAGTRVQVQVPR